MAAAMNKTIANDPSKNQIKPDTLGFSPDQQTFQISFPKESRAECFSDAEKLQKKLPFVSVTATCEPSLVYPQNKNEKSVNT